ncbi:hypothetical protein HUJ05_008182 [Dendroctonus ponderosae]|nr:hypothetical protein HUJ05_008182 [Dendroctonus ponderosae]
MGKPGGVLGKLIVSKFNLPTGSRVIMFPGSQFYIDGIERLTQTKAIKMGKPGGILGELIVSKFNLPTGSRVLMVGDNIHSDIQFGINSGFKTLLVLSGVTKQEHVDQWDAAEELKPDFVGRSIADLHEKIRNM